MSLDKLDSCQVISEVKLFMRRRTFSVPAQREWNKSKKGYILSEYILSYSFLCNWDTTVFRIWFGKLV